MPKAPASRETFGILPNTWSGWSGPAGRSFTFSASSPSGTWTGNYPSKRPSADVQDRGRVPVAPRTLKVADATVVYVLCPPRPGTRICIEVLASGRSDLLEAFFGTKHPERPRLLPVTVARVAEWPVASGERRSGPAATPA